jgi:hypothetical protein
MGSVLATLRLTLVLALVGGLLALGPAARSARAELIATEAVIGSTSAADEARDSVRDFMEREVARSHFQSLGIDPEEAKARVAALSDSEVREVADRLDRLPAGGSAVGAVVGAALIVFLVLLLTDILGFTDVFPFVKKTVQR